VDKLHEDHPARADRLGNNRRFCNRKELNMAALEYASLGGKSHASRENAFQNYLKREGITAAQWEQKQPDAALEELALSMRRLKFKYAR